MQYGNSNVKMHGVPQAKFAQATPVQTNLLNAKQAHALHSQGGHVQQQQAAPAKKYNDVGFAVLFWAHLALMVYLGVAKGLPELNGTADSTSTADYKYVAPETDVAVPGTEIMGGIVICLIVGICLALGYVKLCLWWGESLIHTSTRCMIGIYFIFAILFFSSGYMGGAILCLICGGITCCWYSCVQRHIPFAGQNLAVSCDAASQFPTLFMVAFGALLMNMVWNIIWFLAIVGVVEPSKSAVVTMPGGTYDSQLCTSVPAYSTEFGDNVCNDEQNGCCYCALDSTTDFREGACYSSTMTQLTYFGMLVSFYWGSTVISNVMHCVTAGAVATWWFKSDFGSTPVFDSFYRAMTTSFGSICLGSLLVAILKATRQMLREARKNRNAQMFLCIIECCLSFIESLLEYFNRYAFCYVAIYGYDFKAAGKAVFDLFRSKGWTTIINDDLIDTALSFGCMGCGVLTGFIGWSYSVSIGVSSDYQLVLFICGLIAGFAMSQVTLNVISSAVATVFVCFAENPAALANTRPQRFNQLNNAWKTYQGDNGYVGAF